jgi:hypothetical protein
MDANRGRPARREPRGMARRALCAALRKGQELQQLRGCARSRGQAERSESFKLVFRRRRSTTRSSCRGLELPSARSSTDRGLDSRPPQCTLSPQRFGAIFLAGPRRTGLPRREHTGETRWGNGRGHMSWLAPPLSTNQSRGFGLDSEARAERTDSCFFRPRLAGRPPHKIENSEAARAPSPRLFEEGKSSRSRIFAVLPCSLSLFHSPRPRLFADSVQKAS